MPFPFHLNSQTLSTLDDLNKLKRNTPWETCLKLEFSPNNVFLDRTINYFRTALHANTSIKIFHLEFEGTLLNTTQISSIFQMISDWLKINTKLKGLHLSCKGVTIDHEDFIGLTTALAQHPKLENFTLENFSTADINSLSLAMDILGTSQTLRSIKINPDHNNEHSALNATATKAMLELINSNPLVQTVSLPWHQEFHQDEQKEITKLLKHNQSLKTLEINGRINDETLRTLSKILKQNDSIHSLRLMSHNQIQSTGINALAKGLRAKQNLEEIYIEEIRLEESPSDDKAVSFLFETLKQSPLKRLTLGFEQFNNNTAHQLADLITHLPDLESLHLRQENNALDEQHLFTLSQAIEANSNIKALKMPLGGPRNYSNESLNALIKAIDNRTELTCLHIFGLSPLPNSFIKKLTRILKNKKNLGSLNISYYGMSNRRLYNLLEALKDHTALIDWDYYDYNINRSVSLKHKAFLKRNCQLTWLKECFREEFNLSSELDSDDNSASSAKHELNDDIFKKAKKIVKSMRGHPEHEKLGQTILNSFTLRNHLASNNILQALTYFDARRDALLEQCRPLLARAILAFDDYSFLSNRSLIKKRAFQLEAKTLKMKAVIALLSHDFQNPDSEALLLQSVYQLLNPKEKHLPEILSYQDIGFERLIPLAYLQTLMSSLMDKINPRSRIAWERITENIHRLAQSDLTLLCQEAPLKEALEQALGTTNIALFETILNEKQEALDTGLTGKQEADKALDTFLEPLSAQLADRPENEKKESFEMALEKLLAIAKENVESHAKKSSRHSKGFFQLASAEKAAEEEHPECTLM